MSTAVSQLGEDIAPLSLSVPAVVPNWIGGAGLWCHSTLVKRAPTNGRVICQVTRSQAPEVEHAIAAAQRAQPAWAATPAVERGRILHEVAAGLQARRDDVARLVASETGKSLREALGETDGAIAQGRFMAGEGQRLYGRTTTSAVSGRQAMTLRQPVGIAGLIIAANTPIANVAWKVFPALVCGNAVVLKAAEDAPLTAWAFARIAEAAGLPAGVLNVIQGFGEEAGEPLVRHPAVGVVSFTGSTAVGRRIAVIAGERLAKVSLELGGKNAFVVCDDADLDQAVHWALLSAFSNAGQRCAAGSRIIVFDAIAERFIDKLVAGAKALRVGPADGDDLGPVINGRQLDRLLAAIVGARESGARVLCGGHRLTDAGHRNGYYLAPTLIEGLDPRHEVSTTELFGPIACLYRVRDFASALALANDSPYGLTACIHTRGLDRAMAFVQGIHTGVAVVNAGTYGSEPHMPFGGLKDSGNGTREPGTEAIDIYTELKNVYLNTSAADV